MTATTLEKPKTKKKTADLKMGRWGSLSRAITNDMSPKEMMVACGADWDVSKEPEYIKLKGKEIRTGKYALVRSDNGKILSSVSEDWQYNLNSTAFDFFDEFAEEGSLTMDSAGVLDEGRKVWVLAKVNESFALFNGKDVIESYLLFSNPHQYGMSVTVMGTDIRISCENSLQFALSKKSDTMIRISHRNEFNPELVKQTLFEKRKTLNKYKEAAEFLAKKKASTEDTLEFFKKLFPLTSNKKGKEISRNAGLLVDILETQPGAEFGPGTWWANFNAVTYATDHLIGNREDTRLHSALFGAGRNRKIDALNLALKMAA